MDKYFHPTLYKVCGYLLMLGIKLICANKIEPKGQLASFPVSIIYIWAYEEDRSATFDYDILFGTGVDFFFIMKHIEVLLLTLEGLLHDNWRLKWGFQNMNW